MRTRNLVTGALTANFIANFAELGDSAKDCGQVFGKGAAPCSRPSWLFRFKTNLAS